MPHSISPKDTTIQGIQIADAETNNGDAQTTEGSLTAEDAGTHGESQINETLDQDMTMADMVPEVIAKEEKPEVKLEDLFADMESDEEFPISNNNDTKLLSSPEAPPSPV